MLIGTPERLAEAHEEWGSVVLQRLIDDYVDPELSRRIEEDSWDGSAPVVLLQVLFPRGNPPVVRINGEVKGKVQAVAARDLQAGEEVSVEDYTGLASYEPGPEDDGVPHVTALRHRDGWGIVFDLNYRHPQRFEHYERGRDFAMTAQEALDAGRAEVALDVAYSAAELLAKAELLSCGPAVDYVLGSKKHSKVATSYSLWARLGNTDAAFARLLHRLGDLRGKARYLDARQGPKDEEPAGLLGVLRQMEEHVRCVVENDFPNEHPRSFNAVAARDVRWGDIVEADAITLKP